MQNKKKEFSKICFLFRQNGGKILNNRLCGVLAVTRAFGDYSLKSVGLTAAP